MNIALRRQQEESLAHFFNMRSPDMVVRHQGFLEHAISPDFLPPRIAAICEGLQRITNEPERHTHFPWHPLHIDAYGPKYAQEVGLKPSKPGDGENKWVFHYADGMIDELIAAKVPVDEYADFFRALQDLDLWSLQIAAALAKAFDRTNNYRDGKRKYKGSMAAKIMRGRRVIRGARYLKKDDDLPDAKPHVDRGAFTVHPWSSHKGLKLVSPGRTVRSVDETTTDKVLVFPGEKFAALTEGMFGFGTPHGVRDERRTNGTRDEDRYAIVCFVHPETTDEDAQWLLENRDAIERFEETISF